MTGIMVALSLATAAQVAVGASTMDKIVKLIAENVLGRDSVKAVRVSADAIAVMRWEAATYKPQNSIATSRELPYDEAGLVTGAILGSLRDIRGISFTMTRGGQVLATGEVSRSREPGAAAGTPTGWWDLREAQLPTDAVRAWWSRDREPAVAL